MVCRGDGIYKRKELRRAQAADHGPRGVLLNGRDHLSKNKDSLDRGYREEKLQQVRKLAASRGQAGDAAESGPYMYLQAV
ncbi:hypothetical protein CVIRNUC_004816 [Coccomyxa viridis]|uniref:Uncharacterized protein n=1 Tax=Coccomyxa viridis TaxID=1274662 RepID=A0AAV1I480_9CHLO|nr:hypothetical protein CVIRNUC_004816 [Coccomyxa viridis]